MLQATQSKPYRHRKRIIFSFEKIINFASNDYLGLAKDQRVIAALKHGADQYGAGGQSSALICGYTAAHKQVEQQICTMLGYNDAMLFSSGTLANYGLITTIANRQTEIFHDKYNHASLLDATTLAKAKLSRFKHLDYKNLEFLLQRSKFDQKIIVSESLFSMHGNLADISTLKELANCYNALLIIDDSHGFGYVNFDKTNIDGYMAGFGKATGCNGAVVCGSTQLIEKMTQSARQYIYTTAISPAICCAISASLNIISSDRNLITKLNDNILYFQTKIKNSGLDFNHSTTAIQTLNIVDELLCVQIKDELLAHNILVGAIRPPSVPPGQSRLRINLSATHSLQDIDVLFSRLVKLLCKKI